MLIPKPTLTVAVFSLLSTFAVAQTPQVLGPVRSVDSLIPGTNVYRCGTPTSAFVGPIDHPDCDGGNTNPLASYEGGLLRIPVVVHILHQTNGQGNLSDPQVQSQITVLNEDFQAIAGTPGAPGHNSNIEFFLATADPQGAATTGITRHANNSWHNDSGNYWSSTSWDSSRYLNIYVNNPGFLGYIPALPHTGLTLGLTSDRVVVHYQSFGRPSPGFPYNSGRTCTHEVGHYLGLFHTFDGGCGFGSCYNSGDLICDTNPEANPRFGCQPSASSCGSVDPARNYLDYSDDACMNHFTQEQVRRMRCTLQHYRPNLAQPGGPIASSSVRTGPGNFNSNYSCTAPTLGVTMTASIITFGLPYTLCSVYGYTGAASTPFSTYTILIDTNSAFVLELPFQVPTAGVVATRNLPIPHLPSVAATSLACMIRFAADTVPDYVLLLERPSFLPFRRWYPVFPSAPT